MMDAISSADVTIFLFINHLPHTLLLDILARGVSGVGQWGAIWIVFAVMLFFREERRDHYFFISFICAGVLAALSEGILKWIIARPRPTAELGAIILTNPGNYSFPSTHTTIAFAFAYILSKVDSKSAALFYIVACMIALSRIYLGVHFPSDVIGGAVLGSLIGYGAIVLENSWYNRTHETKRKATSYRRSRSRDSKIN